MKTEILRIINGDPELEPIILLSSKFEQLNKNEDKESFIYVLKELILSGTKTEIFASLNIINLIGMADECKFEIKQVVENFNFMTEKKLLAPLLSLCSVISENWSIRFIVTAINEYKSIINDSIYYYDISFRSIISTSCWKDVLPEFSFILNIYANDDFIDLIAFFIWQQGRNGLKVLLDNVNNAQFNEMIARAKSDIYDRFSGHYARFDILI